MADVSPAAFLAAARVPPDLPEQSAGRWSIERCEDLAGPLTVLRVQSWAGLHRGGEVLMEDSERELRRHLPIWLAAHGRVLVTGLGLGCVVRGLLASDRVERIDVIEREPFILAALGPEFAAEPRITLHPGDALTFDLAPGLWWDFACHWPGCDRQVPPALWGCARHWYSLPLRLRRMICHAYRPGQEIDRNPSRQYLAVAREVRDWIRANHGAPPRQGRLL